MVGSRIEGLGLQTTMTTASFKAESLTPLDPQFSDVSLHSSTLPYP